MADRSINEQIRDRRASLGEALRTPYENDSDEDSVVVQAAKEVDSERREIDEEIVERMKGRQRYFYEKAQMHREAADHYTRMSEDIAELLNNDYVNGTNKIQPSHGIVYGDGPVPR